MVADVLYDGNLSQQGDVHLLGQLLDALLAEEEVLLVGMLGWREPSHVFYQAEDGHVDLLVLIHINTLACIRKSHLLWGADDDGTRDGERLHEGEVDVAGAGRCIEDEVVKVAPVGVADELFECVASHAASPKRGLVGVDEESDAQHLDAVLFDGDDEVASVDVLAVRTCVLHLEHLGHGGTEDVAVENANAMAQTCQGNGQVGCHGALTYAALPAAYGNDVLYARQEVWQVGTWSLQSFRLDFHFGILAGKGVDGRLASLDDRLHERIGGLVEDEGERDVKACDAQVILDHLHLHDVLARARVAYRGQGIHDEFGI